MMPRYMIRVLTLSNHGRARGQTKQFWPDMVGFKYKMSNSQAAIGCGQVERINELITRKREIFKAYHSLLADLPIQMNPEAPGTTNGYWMPTMVMNPEVPLSREELLTTFKQANIDGRVFFWPLSMTGLITGNPSTSTSYQIFERAINLPSYHDITTSDLNRVAHVIRETMGASRA
jgi:perosamine synthetase